MRVMRREEEIRYHQLLRLCHGEHRTLEIAFRLAREDDNTEIQFKDIVQIIRQMQENELQQ